MIDMGGLGTAAVDNEGWSYAVDFPWLHQPPNPGAGRFKRVRPPSPIPVLVVTNSVGELPHVQAFSCLLVTGNQQRELE